MEYLLRLSFARLRDQVIVCRIEIVCRWSSDVNPPVYNPDHSDFNPAHTPAETETSRFGISASRKERWSR